MGKALTEIAEEIRDINKKVLLIYAFNGVGKTRLSCEFKQLISPKGKGTMDGDDTEHPLKILYYNAFTEDLFYWDNDLDNDLDRKLLIRPNAFTDWVLRDEGKEIEISKHFSRYTNSKISPDFSSDFLEVTFSSPGSGTTQLDRIKISKSEESNFIWCVFYSMLESVIEELNTTPENRSTDKFDHLEYIFIDDPVTSLDENHLIELAVDLSQLIKSSQSNLRFILTTHNPLFYNVLSNEFAIKDSEHEYSPKKCERYKMDKIGTDLYEIQKLNNEIVFANHLFLLSILKKAVDSDSIEKYHFYLLRNILEKTSVFLGHMNWGDLLEPGLRQYQARLINISSHSKLSSLESLYVTGEDKTRLKELVDFLVAKYNFQLTPIVEQDTAPQEQSNG